MTTKELELLKLLSKFYNEMNKQPDEGKKLIILLQTSNDIETLFESYKENA